MNTSARTHRGTALAVLLVHALLFTVILAHRQKNEASREPRWITLTLPAAVPTPRPAPAPAGRPAAVRTAPRALAPSPLSPVVPAPAAIPMASPEPELVSPAPDFGLPAPRVGDRQVREAIAATIREEDARRAKFIRAAPPPGISEKFAAGAKAAEVPGCLRPDALKHNPPTVGPIVFSGLLSLPWLAGAALTGKCK